MIARRKKEWFDDDALWRDLYPFMFPDERFAHADHEVEKVLGLAKPAGKSVLDLCCGPGRCSIALAQRGFGVTGVDRTKYLLDKARAKGRAAKAKIEWVEMDMRDFVRPDAFGLVLSMFTSFGYFDRKEEDTAVLENMLASLRPGGSFLIDVVGKEPLARVLQPTVSRTLPDGTTLVQRNEVIDNWTRIRCEWILIRKGRAKSHTIQHTVYSGQELKDRMERAGFVDIELYGNLNGDKYGPDAQRLIAVGRKAGAKKRSSRTKVSSRRPGGRS